MLELVFIGSKFYHASGTIMAPLTTAAGLRADWSTVEHALEAGHTVTIKPATAAQLHAAENRLQQIKADPQNGFKS